MNASWRIKPCRHLTLVLTVLVAWTHPSLAVSANEGSGGGDTWASVSAITPIVFKQRLRIEGFTKALQYRNAGYTFATDLEINHYNISSAHGVDGTAREFVLREAPLESPYWATVRNESGARAFLHTLAEALRSELSQDSKVFKPVRGNAVKKAIAQRDVFQTYSLVVHAETRVRRASDRKLAVRLRHLLANVFRALLLDESEYEALVGLVPSRLPDRFTTQFQYSLVDNYLPLRAIAADESWLEMPSGGVPFRHFRDYRGRSFIKVYLRASRASSAELVELWQRLFRAYGDRLHLTGLNGEPVPEGLETMLVRSFGVFLTNGAYRDSLWPEEVIIRAFKYPTARVDLTTSDFRGTLFYQYKMSRGMLLRDPSSLGLRRVFDDDEQFFGFFGDVPDKANGGAAWVTTMRSNCIACHSELFYGLNTIFSLERDPGPDPMHVPAEHSMLRKQANGEYELQTDEYQSIKTLLGGRASKVPGGSR